MNKVLERFMRDQENKANSLYNAGYKDGWEDCYNEKVAEAWSDGYQAGEEHARQQEEEKVWDLWVEEEPIRVGDEVEDPNGLKAIVTNYDTHMHLIYPHNGKTWKVPHDQEYAIKRTGKEFDTLCQEK